MPAVRRSGIGVPLLVAALLAVWPDAGVGQEGGDRPVVRGTVLDAETTRRLRASVLLLAPDRSVLHTTRSDSLGRFALTVEPGVYGLRVEQDAYLAVERQGIRLRGNDTVYVELRLVPEVVSLDTLRVVAPGIPADERAGLVGMDDFFERYARYKGSAFAAFMTRDSLAVWEDRAQTPGHMLQWTTRMVRGVDPVSGEITLRGDCQPLYYLNGSRVPHELVSTLSPGTLEAVEVYVRPAIPAVLAHRSPCGVVSFWSRQSPPDAMPENRVLRTVALGGVFVALLYVFASSMW